MHLPSDLEFEALPAHERCLTTAIHSTCRVTHEALRVAGRKECSLFKITTMFILKNWNDDQVIELTTRPTVFVGDRPKDESLRKEPSKFGRIGTVQQLLRTFGGFEIYCFSWITVTNANYVSVSRKFRMKLSVDEIVTSANRTFKTVNVSMSISTNISMNIWIS